MVKLKIVIGFILFIFSYQCKNSDSNLNIYDSIWISKNGKWENPPLDVLGSSYSENSRLIIFRENANFYLIECTLYRNSSDSCINVGAEGGNYFRGKWKASNSTLYAEYFIENRTIQIVPFEKTEKQRIKFNFADGILCSENDTFIRVFKFNEKYFKKFN